MKSATIAITSAALLNLGAAAASASPAEVVKAEASGSGDNWTVSATVRHDDTGWDHYAERFIVSAPDGTELAIRVLAHPHVDEQPFTRSVGGVAIPADADFVTVQAIDNNGDASGAAFRLEIAR